VLTGLPLRRALATAPSRPFRAIYFRATPLLYGNDPLGKNRGRSSPLSAGRFNVAGGARVLYLADTHQTCAAELQAVGGASFAIATIPVHVNLQAVLDLQDPATLSALALTTPEIAINFRLNPPPTPAQELGEACAKYGNVDGILYKSLTPAGGICLAVIEPNLRAGASSLVVSDPRNKLVDQLP
jgi:hypothetical protein